MSYDNYYDDVDNEIAKKETGRLFSSYKSRRPLAYCQDCGKPIYKADKDGEPYRLCFQCSNS